MTEVLLLAVVMLRELPLATTLNLRLIHPFAREAGKTDRPYSSKSSPRVVWTTSAAGYARARDAGAAAFAPDEYEAVALAAELGRAGPRELDRWIEWKLASAHAHALDMRHAMGGADGLVPYHEVYREQRVRGAGDGHGGGARWERVLVRRVSRDGVQAASTWTFAQLAAHFGLELVDVVVHERVAKASEAREQEQSREAAAAAEPEATWASV